ncbi:hypothetical protein [Asticcacaulis sp. AC402]|uniref:hypothetical protein n=1 Tax=Asticcacaulis sp. AC402 TaxID=1282361 RepID=UPI0003C3DE8C|nr:hypothetical protein [Asticcacaulis sp. AC402]ESQ76383.1 hypothetical protein ABAC402_04595 [Asticcacaulis sp. AC402]
MNKLNIDFAFEGFRIIRQKPSAILFWGIILLIFNGGSMYALAALAGDALTGFDPQSSDPQAILSLYAKMAPAYAIIMPLAILQHAILSCAVYRGVLGETNSSFGWLRFGGAELRQILLMIIFFFLFIALYIGVVLAATIVGGLVAFALGLVSQNLAFVGIVVGVLVAIGAIFLIMTRLSLFGVQSFDQKKINLFGSWKLTAGNGWALFWGYVIMAIMILLVYLLCMVIFTVVAIVMSGGNFAAMQPIFSGNLNVDMFLQPLYIAYMLVLNLLVMPLMMALSLGAPAAAYKQLIGSTKAKVENVF